MLCVDAPSLLWALLPMQSTLSASLRGARCSTRALYEHVRQGPRPFVLYRSRFELTLSTTLHCSLGRARATTRASRRVCEIYRALDVLLCQGPRPLVLYRSRFDPMRPATRRRALDRACAAVRGAEASASSNTLWTCSCVRDHVPLNDSVNQNEAASLDILYGRALVPRTARP